MQEFIINIWTLATASPLGSMVAGLYLIIIFNRLLARKHYYTARYMRFVRNKLKVVVTNTTAKFNKLYVEYLKSKPNSMGCIELSCGYKKRSFEHSLMLSMKDISDDLKLARHANGYHSLSSYKLKKYIEELSFNLLNSSRDFIKQHNPELYDFIIWSESKRFSLKETIELVTELVEYDIRLHNEEKADMLKALAFIKFKIIKD